MASDSSDVDNALVAKLGADSALLALMPNGVYWDEAPQGATRFVIVSLIDEHDEQQFSARAFEDALYLIEAGRSRRVAGT
jgi:predicted PhzF superfamily epimerase YddE/YHI9